MNLRNLIPLDLYNSILLLERERERERERETL